jgi:poly-gamma-glutamate capsule biosynthesis protein CapA/YwtB (metallophosphatase superfamily)/outer membrane protein assembly factor BamB
VWQYTSDDDILAMSFNDLTFAPGPNIMIASDDGMLRVFRSNADDEIYWTFAADVPLVALGAARLDSVAPYEVLAGGDDNILRVLSPENGQLLWETDTGARISVLENGDLNGNSLDEILAGLWGGTLAAYGQDGTELWRVSTVDGGDPTALAFSDLEADGAMDILLATSHGALEVLDTSGTRLWAVETGTYLSQILPVDLDGGGRAEILAATRDGDLMAFESDGSLRWSVTTGTRLTDVLVANVDGESGLEVVTSGGPAPGRVIVTDEEGRTQWIAELEGGVRSLSAGDLDRDGTIDIIAGGDDGQITLLDRFGQTRGTYHTSAPVTTLYAQNFISVDGNPEVLVRSGDAIHLFRAVTSGEAGSSASAPTDTLLATPDDMFHPPGAGEVELVLGGDVSLSQEVMRSAVAYGSLYPFQATADLLRRADVTAVNLSGTLAVNGAPDRASGLYRASPDFAQGLQLAGIDVAFLANPHTLDYGQRALDETVAVLAQHGVHPVGVGENRDAAYMPIIIEAKGIRIAFLAFADGLPQGWDAKANAPGIAPANTGRIERAVRNAGQQADVVVVGFYMGRPGDTSFNVRQQSLAQSAINAGAALVVGYGTGTVQEAAFFRDGFVAYSLGDFANDEATQDGALLRVLLTSDGLQTVDLIPVQATLDGQARFVAESDLPVVERLYPRGVVFESPRINADPGPATDYTLDVDLEYGEKRLDVTQTVTTRNDSDDTWNELAFSVPANFIENVFELDGVSVTHYSSRREVEAELDEEETILRVALPESVPPGAFVSAELRYALFPAPLYPTDWQPYSSFSYDDKLMQAGEWYPVLVPYATGEGWFTWEFHPVGDPMIYSVADYDVTIHAPPGVTVVSGGETSRPGDVSAGGAWRFHLENARSVGFLASPTFRCVSREVEGINLRSCYQPEHDVAGREVLDMTERAFTLFSDLYGPYQHDDLVVAENGYYGAMEYSATLSITEPAYAFYNEFPDTLLEALVAHEVAHMWWYEVVGNDQVHEPWLDESLASYSELLYYEHYYPELTAWWWNYRVLQYEPTGPVDVTIYDHVQTEPFIRNMYGQASFLMQDLRRTMGDPAFFAFLQDYYESNAGQIVTADDFFAAARRHTDENLSGLLNGYFRNPDH